MRRLSLSALVLAVLLAAPALLAEETLTQCLINCPPGVNSCSNCCLAQFTAAVQPCYNDCQNAENACLQKAAMACNKLTDPYEEQRCMFDATNVCNGQYFSCRRACNPTIAGGCPGEVPPQKCPYTCQMWNPASQSCIGPHMNGC